MANAFDWKGAAEDSPRVRLHLRLVRQSPDSRVYQRELPEFKTHDPKRYVSVRVTPPGGQPRPFLTIRAALLEYGIRENRVSTILSYLKRWDAVNVETDHGDYLFERCKFEQTDEAAL